MRKVISTKHHSLKQMENMAYNLRKKFKRYYSVEYSIDFNAHANTKEVRIREVFKIYTPSHFIYPESWQELQKQYHKLMSRKEG